MKDHLVRKSHTQNGGSDSTSKILTLSRTKFDFLEDHGPILFEEDFSFKVHIF